MLQVRLKVERALEQSQAVGQLHHRLVRLHSNIWIQLLRPPLKILQVIAKMTVDNAQADQVDRTRDQERAGNAETAIAALLSEPNKHLIKQGVEAPVPALKFAGVEVAEAAVVVPKAGFVITDQAAIPRQAVGLIRNLPNREEGPIH